jgi:hypothetical protein
VSASVSRDMSAKTAARTTTTKKFATQCAISSTAARITPPTGAQSVARTHTKILEVNANVSPIGVDTLAKHSLARVQINVKSARTVIRARSVFQILIWRMIAACATQNGRDPIVIRTKVNV